MSWTDGSINGVGNKEIANVNNAAKADIEFVNNVQGGFELVIKPTVSAGGGPRVIVYTSVNPTYRVANGDVLYEDVDLMIFLTVGMIFIFGLFLQLFVVLVLKKEP